MTKALTIAPGDSVATLLEDAHAGDIVADVRLTADIPRGHKVALSPIAANAPVLKYGFPIGRARRAIAPGEHVHSDNLATGLSGTGSYTYDPKASPTPEARTGATFQGYVRADGRVGTRNEIWILPTVGCVARTAERLSLIHI